MTIYPIERMAISQLKQHPRNYKDHPQEQLAHIMHSIKEHGFYRNVVIARDHTILAGHGVVKAAMEMGLRDVPVIRLDLDPNEPRALKIMTSDNEIGKLAETNDRALTELLKDIMTADDLLGTGFDDMSLSALVMVSRPVEEIADKCEAEEWLGMPEFDAGTEQLVLIVSFRTADDRERFIVQSGVGVVRKSSDKNSKKWSGWWPPMMMADRANLRFEEGNT